MQVRYCGADCQKNHWPKHKKDCKIRAAELRDEALFKDPPAQEDCSICFLPKPFNLLSCISLPPATISSVPIYDFAIANEELAAKEMEEYNSCCGKSICKGCLYSFAQSGNLGKCPYCNYDRCNKRDEVLVEEILNRVEANDAASICMLAGCYYHGELGLQQDHARAIELYARAAELGNSKARFNLGNHHRRGGDLKKAKFTTRTRLWLDS